MASRRGGTFQDSELSVACEIVPALCAGSTARAVGNQLNDYYCTSLLLCRGDWTHNTAVLYEYKWIHIGCLDGMAADENRRAQGMLDSLRHTNQSVYCGERKREYTPPAIAACSGHRAPAKCCYVLRTSKCDTRWEVKARTDDQKRKLLSVVSSHHLSLQKYKRTNVQCVR